MLKQRIAFFHPTHPAQQTLMNSIHQQTLSQRPMTIRHVQHSSVYMTSMTAGRTCSRCFQWARKMPAVLAVGQNLILCVRPHAPPSCCRRYLLVIHLIGASVYWPLSDPLASRSTTVFRILTGLLYTGKEVTTLKSFNYAWCLCVQGSYISLSRTSDLSLAERPSYVHKAHFKSKKIDGVIGQASVLNRLQIISPGLPLFILVAAPCLSLGISFYFRIGSTWQTLPSTAP